MHTPTTEDTIIGSRPRAAMDLFGNEIVSDENPGLIERCRAKFRLLGEQLTSFELSRQIYGY